MIPHRFRRLPVLLAVLMLFAAHAASVTVGQLRTEYLENPLGLDVPQPRFSWKLVPVNPRDGGQAQSAYQIQVASSPQAWERRTPEVWDSREVRSVDSHLVAYAGPALRPNQTCFWRVRVRDEKNRWSDWSAPAFWSMGPLTPSDWTAQWIGTDQVFQRGPGFPPPDNTLADPWLRKTFSLPAAPQRAYLHVASVGYHEVYINGQRVGDTVLAPAVSDFTQRARFVTYDITAQLRSGENVLGLWLGTSWSIFPPHQSPDRPASPLVLAQADVMLPGGQNVRVVTEGSWLWHPSPNTLLGVWDFMHFGGEHYDANREIPNWAQPGLDTSAWKPVKVFQPHLTLSAQKVEPNRRRTELKPVEITEPKPGVWRVDFGRVFTGWVELKVRGQPGDRIELQWSERAEQPMTHRLRSLYTVGPSGQGTFCNRFNYGVGRWIQLEGLRQKPAPEDLRAWLIRTDYASATTFACSDPLLNRIHATTLWTFENLSLGGYVVDCAQRERMGYGGDAHATTDTALDHYHLGAFYTKWSEDWRDVQGHSAAWGVNRPADAPGAGKRVNDGNLPYTAPTYWGGGGPAWSGYCVTLPWEIYRRHGDRRFLEQNLDTIQRWLGFLESKAQDNLLRRYGGEWDFLGDWLWPGAEGVNGDTRETLFFNNCYWVYNLRTAARIARALGRADLARAWTDRATAVAAAVHREFYDAKNRTYVNGFQAYLAAALLAEIMPESLRSTLAARLEHEIRTVRKGHFWAGITGGHFVFKQLIESDRPDLAYEMVSQEDYPSWGDMLRRGATTIWEDWEGKLSLSHSSYLHVGLWFIQGLAGIRPGLEGRGYRDFILQPGWWPGCPIESMQCRFESPYGPIDSEWRRDGNDTRFEVGIPPNAQATLSLPAGGLTAIVFESSNVKKAPDTQMVQNQGQTRVAIRLGPGRHAFRLRRE